MGIISRLNDRLNYNQEMYYLSMILCYIFAIASLINVKIYPQLSLIFICIAILSFGISISYFIYNRNDNAAHGYIVRDRIRGWFGK